jgi:hypothetical protein
MLSGMGTLPFSEQLPFETNVYERHTRFSQHSRAQSAGLLAGTGMFGRFEPGRSNDVSKPPQMNGSIGSIVPLTASSRGVQSAVASF